MSTEQLPAPVCDEQLTLHALEAELLAGAQRGDPEAFGELYSLHYKSLYNMLLSKTRGDHARAEDLVQTAGERAFRNLDAFEDQGNKMAGYLARIAQNAFYDEARYWRVRPTFLGGLCHDNNLKQSENVLYRNQPSAPSAEDE